MDKDWIMRTAGVVGEAASTAMAFGEALSKLSFVMTEEPGCGHYDDPEPAKAVALEDVRAALAAKSRDGFTAEVRALLAKHGASRLSEVKQEEYAALLAEAEALGNA